MNKEGKHTLKLESLSLGYDKPLLQHVSASFGVGLTGVIGNNGKGKTTLFKCLSGLLRTRGGKVFFNEKDLLKLDGRSKAEIISFNSSSNPVSFPITVFELVSMGRYPYLNQWAGLGAEDEKIVNEALEICGISAFKNKMVNALSDGERQKAFIAKSIAQQTPVMLFDEPTAFLDYASKKHFFSLAKELALKQGKIILISSHDIDFLTSYADSLLMIEDDETVVTGSTAEVMATSYFKTHFTKI